MQANGLRGATYIGILWLVLMIFPSILQASSPDDSVITKFVYSNGGGSRQQGMVAIVSGNVGGAETLIASWLESEKIQIIDGPNLQSRLKARQVGVADSQIVAKFEGLEAAVAEGTESFYYKGNDAAIEILRPAFDRGLTHLDVTARNSEYVEHVFQAGLMLIRAYSGAGDGEQASEIAGKLAVYFPGKEPSLTVVPPDVVELWRTEVLKVSKGRTSVYVEHGGNAGCDARINGVAIGAKPVTIQADMDYMLAIDCGQGAGALWLLRAKGGENLQVPLSSTDFMGEMPVNEDGVIQRVEMEFWLKSLAYWATVDTVIGVFKSDSEHLVVRFDRGAGETGANTEWIERTIAGGEISEKVFDEMMLEAFPVVAQARAEKADADRLRVDAGAGTSGWVTPVLFTTGAVAAVVGGVFVFSASEDANVMSCSPNATAPLSVEQCKGVEQLRFSNSEQYYERWDEINRSKVIGYSGIGVGAALVGWGVWRLISGSGLSEPSTGQDIVVWGGRESIGGSAKWRF